MKVASVLEGLTASWIGTSATLTSQHKGSSPLIYKISKANSVDFTSQVAEWQTVFLKILRWTVYTFKSMWAELEDQLGCYVLTWMPR